MSNNILLRDVIECDLLIFFEQQLDSDSNDMAAFTSKDPTDWTAFQSHWTKILSDDSITIKTIIFRDNVAGHVLCYEQFGETEVSYWIGKNYWGKGLATKALLDFLEHIKVRPLYARVAKDNIASNRVLEKCGFKIYGEDKGFSNSRNQDVEEFILKLED